MVENMKKEFTPYNGDAQFGNVESFVIENITDVFQHSRIELPHVERFEGKFRLNNDGVVLLFVHYKDKTNNLVGFLSGFTLEEVEILNEQIDCLVSREVFDEIVRHSMIPKKYFTYPLLVLLTFTPFFVKAQKPYIISDYFVVGESNIVSLHDLNNRVCKTDSVKWITIDTVSNGKNNCVHNLIFSETYIRNGYYGCLVMHGQGCHCDMNDDHRRAICDVCGYHVEQRLVTYQSSVKKEPSDYERTINLFNLFKKQ